MASAAVVPADNVLTEADVVAAITTLKNEISALQSGQAPVSVTAATVTLSAANHGNRTTVLDRAAGIAVTLPASSGSGVKFRLHVKTTVTSNSTTVKVANATDVMQGTAIQAADGGATVGAYEAAATDDTITFNGSTTGGLAGDQVELEDVATGFWSVRVVGAATGTEATPFSATVS
jgi:hypothetical protein